MGRRLQPWLDDAPRYEVRAEPGDVCVVNHQRMMHGRKGFEGDRLFIRMLYWFAEPFEAPEPFVAEARRFLEALGERGRCAQCCARLLAA